MRKIKFREVLGNVAFIVSIILLTIISCDILAGLNKIDTIEVEKKCDISIMPIEKIYMHEFGSTGDPYREDLHGDIRCSCIRSVRSFGVNIPSETDAIDLKPNTEIRIGVVALFLTHEKDKHHVAVVTKVEEEGFWVKEGNYVECEITERYISFKDNRIIGYYEYGK